MDVTFIAAGRRRKLFRDQPGGHFKIRFQHNGVDIEKSTFTNVVPAAKERAKQLIEDTTKNDLLTADATFGQLVSRFLATRSAKAKNDASFAATLRSTFQLTMKTPARSIRPGDLLSWLTAQAVARKWRSRTFNHYRLWLWQIFDLAVRDRLMRPEENPFYGKAIRRRRLEPVVRNIPTLEQFAAIISDVRTAEGEELADFLEFLGCAGVGQAEAASLTWADVGTQKMRFVRRKTGVPFEVPIYIWLGPLLARRQAKRRGAEASARVFATTDAGKALGRACARLEITHFTQRGLRAMLIKRLYDSGVPTKRIALWQGHRDGGKLIQEIYTEVFCETDAAAEKADLELVGGSCNPAAARISVVA